MASFIETEAQGKLKRGHPSTSERLVLDILVELIDVQRLSNAGSFVPTSPKDSLS